MVHSLGRLCDGKPQGLISEVSLNGICWGEQRLCGAHLTHPDNLRTLLKSQSPKDTQGKPLTMASFVFTLMKRGS